MSLPVIQKSWQRVFNIDSGTDNRQILLDRAKALCGLATFGGQLMTQNLWTPIKCCNSTSVVSGFNWNAVGDMVHGNDAGTNARSWILLQNVLGRQWLWDYRGTGADQFYMYISPAGLFTGGTPTARPTATDELGKDPSASSWGYYDTNQSPRMLQNIWLSADGKQTMIAGIHNGTHQTFFLFGDLEDPPSNWAHPTIMYGDGVGDGGGSSFLGDHLIGFSNSINISGEATPGVSGAMRFIGEAVNGVPLVVNDGVHTAINVKNDLSGQWDVLDKFWLASTQETSFGQLGYWPDLWPTMPTQTGYPTGSHFPGSGTLRQFVKFSDLILPWFGAAAMVTV